MAKELTAFVNKKATRITVEGEETKLKGYSKFRFFCFKLNKLWYICEWSSGRQVSGDFETTLATAKKSARAYIAENTDGDQSKIQEAIKHHGIVNKEEINGDA